MLSEEHDQRLEATLVFRRKPQIDVIDFINEMALASDMPILQPTVALREESGSYLLYVQTTLITLGALQTALWLLNGCAAQIIEMKSRLQIIAQKRPPRAIRQRVLLAEQTVPKWMTVVIRGIAAKLTGGSAALNQIACELRDDNLERIEVEKGATKVSARKARKIS
jgi:hypothetical protein